MATDEQGFEEFLRARLPHLLRLGRALTCDERASGVLVEDALLPVLGRWDDSSPFTAEGEVRRSMVRHYLRRPVPVGSGGDAVWDSLAGLTPRQRALVALRLHEDLTDRQIAEVLGCSEASVRASAAHAFALVDADSVRVALDEPVPVDETVLGGVRRNADRRRRRRTLLTTAAVLVAVVLAGGGVLAATVGESEQQGLPEQVLVLDATAPDEVWAMTRDVECPHCTVLWRGDGSADGWRQMYLFELPVFRAQLRMAPNGRDGWVWFASDWLMSTHDGGRTWVVPGVDVRDADVQVQVAGSRVWAVLFGFSGLQLLTSPVDSDDWEQAEEPPTPITLVPFGDEMLALQRHLDPPLLGPVDDFTEVTRFPCDVSSLRSSAGALWMTCPAEDGQRVLHSVDGTTWSEVAQLRRTPPKVYPVSDEAALVDTFDGARLVTTEGGGQDVDLGLGPDDSVADVVFPSASAGYLLTHQGHVLHSDDGGLTWDQIS